MKFSWVKCSWVKCSEGLSNRVSTIIRRYIDQISRSIYGCFFYHILSYFLFPFCTNVYAVYICTYLSNFINYIFLLLCSCILVVMHVFFCMFRFTVSFCVLFVCKCVLYCCHRVSNQFQLTKYIVLHHILSYHIKITLGSCDRAS